MEYDFDYVCNGITEMTRIPIRLYKGSSLLSFYSPIPFKIDPAKPYINTFLEIDSPIKYYITPLSQYYGIIKLEDYSLIIGPSSEIEMTSQNINQLVHEIGIPEYDIDAFTKSLKLITRMPVPMFLKILTLNYYFFTKEKIDISDLMLSQNLEQTENQKISIKSTEINIEEQVDVHTTLEFERLMLELIKKGDVNKLTELFSKASVGIAGKIGNTYLNQLKNIFITSATLASRAAIEGGMNEEEALQLSDYYINHCEKLTKADYIINLQYNMIMDFTKKVNSLYHGNTYTKSVRNAIKYIHDHLNENPSIDDISDAAAMSRSQLSTRFKEETGMTISEFIRKHKIDIAKDLLLHSDMSLLDISITLGFSSQAHFQKVFKEVENITPKDYKALN